MVDEQSCSFMNEWVDFEDSSTLTPGEAFAVLGDETRLKILQRLGEADGALSFSELFGRVDYETTANFSYHLEKLGGHFVRKTDAGYELQQAGRRVVESILSGAVTEAPVIERKPIEKPCPICGAQIEVRYDQGGLVLYCPSCGGTRDGTSPTANWADSAESDILGHVSLPPAGVRDRSPAGVIEAAEVRTVAEAHALSRGVCPRCSARVTQTVRVCEEHDSSAGHCDRCNQQFGVTIAVSCTNCIFEQESVFSKYLLADPRLMAFMIDHDIDPLCPNGFHLFSLDERIRSVEPFEGEFTFRADGETITLTVNEELVVSDVRRRPVPEPGDD